MVNEDLLMARKERNKSKKLPKSKKLVSTLSAKYLTENSELLKYYLEKGFVITKVHNVIRYPKSERIFEDFVNQVTNARKESDNDPDKKLIGDLYKLVGNSLYGKTVENLERHMNVRFTNDRKF